MWLSAVAREIVSRRGETGFISCIARVRLRVRVHACASQRETVVLFEWLSARSNKTLLQSATRITQGKEKIQLERTILSYGRATERRLQPTL